MPVKNIISHIHPTVDNFSMNFHWRFMDRERIRCMINDDPSLIERGINIRRMTAFDLRKKIVLSFGLAYMQGERLDKRFRLWYMGSDYSYDLYSLTSDYNNKNITIIIDDKITLEMIRQWKTDNTRR